MIPIAPAINNKINTTNEKIVIPKTKRKKSKRSCDLCRQKRSRCDGSIKQPCTKCQQAQVDCVYSSKQVKEGSSGRSYTAMLENRVRHMEILIQKLAKQKENASKYMPKENNEEGIDTNNSSICSGMLLYMRTRYDG